MAKTKYGHINPKEVKKFYLEHTGKETAKYFSFSSQSSLENFLAKHNIVKVKKNSQSSIYTQKGLISLPEED